MNCIKCGKSTLMFGGVGNLCHDCNSEMHTRPMKIKAPPDLKKTIRKAITEGRWEECYECEGKGEICVSHCPPDPPEIVGCWKCKGEGEILVIPEEKDL